MEEIVVKYFSGEASTEEREQVEQWRGASEENAKSFLSFKKTWSLTNPSYVSNQDVLASILDQENKEFSIVPIWKQRSFQVAASAIILLGLVFYLFKTDPYDQPFGQVLTVKTEFNLPDGSSVTVQRGGMLRLVDFQDKRELSLSGKAYFDVDRDESKPFLINTEGAIIEVLGTSFVVNARDDDHVTEVMIESGLVSFEQNPNTFGAGSMKINLEKGEMGIIKLGERGIKKKKIRDDNYLAWKNEVITFKNTSLKEVVKLMEDVYAMDVELKNPDLERCKLTAKFNKKSAEDVIAIIAETFALKVTREGDQVILSGASCN